MRRIRDFFEQGTTVPLVLVASALLGLTAIFGFAVMPQIASPLAQMRIEPLQKTVTTGEEFTIEIIVGATVPVNVFAGELLFDNTVLDVAGIDYNVSVADLWAERPWFSNGDGTLNFAGGSLRQGGFVGEESLLTVTFRSKKEGSGQLALRDVAILRHDGLGSEVALGKPLDSVITVDDSTVQEENLVQEAGSGSTFKVVGTLPSTDLNGDGKQSIADVSIFMLHVAGNDKRYDFNGDGEVNTVDLNILLGRL